MPTTVHCGECKTILDEDPATAGEARRPCPVCGSLVRECHVAVSFSIPIAWTTVAAEVKASGIALPPVLLQSVVVPGEKTAEGQLITAVAVPWFEIIKRLKADPELAFEILPRVWEEIIAGAYRKAGFDEVVLTPRSGDRGRDVIAVKHGLGFVRVIDQVKAYKRGHLVTADDVRALVGVLRCDKASKGFLTTTSDFAPKLKEDPLIAPLVPSQLGLVNGEMLLQRLQELARTDRP